MAHTWLEGWKTFRVFIGKKSLYDLSQENRDLIKEVCDKLVKLGALPDGGLGGNFAIRNPKTAEGFFVTAAGSEKSNLKNEDFVLVLHLNWDLQEVVFCGAEGKLPSTDSLLIAKTFAADPFIQAWAHFHKPVKTQYAVKLSYPALDEKEWQKLTDQVASGGRIINLISHTGPEEIPDATIILGNDPQKTFELATELVHAILFRAISFT